MKRQAGEITTALAAAILGAAFAALILTQPNCEAEPEHEICENFRAVDESGVTRTPRERLESQPSVLP